MSVKSFLASSAKAVFKIPDTPDVTPPDLPKYSHPDPAPAPGAFAPAPPPVTDEDNPQPGPFEDDFSGSEDGTLTEKQQKIAERFFSAPPRTPISAAPAAANQDATEQPAPQPAPGQSPQTAEPFVFYGLLYVVEGCQTKFSSIEGVTEYYSRNMTAEGTLQHPPTLPELQEKIAKDLQNGVIRRRGYYLRVRDAGVCDPVPDELNQAMLQDLDCQREQTATTPAPAASEPPAPATPVAEAASSTTPAAPAEPNPAPAEGQPTAVDPPEPAPSDPVTASPQVPPAPDPTNDLAVWLSLMPNGGMEQLVALAQALAAQGALPTTPTPAPAAVEHPVSADPPAPEPSAEEALGANPDASPLPKSFVPLAPTP